MKRRTLLAILTILALVTLACSLTGSAGEEAPEATQPPAESAGETPAPPPEATAPPEPTMPPMESPRVRPADGMVMVHVPAGEFLMGDDKAATAPERPEHLVFLDEYWIDRMEVTNAQYRLCVEAGACTEARIWVDAHFNSDEQPILVPWEHARTYCEWVGGRLPTEAEWEKAARGTDGRTWPWGNEFEPNRANLSGAEDGYGFTAPVGVFPGDASPYGLLDVTGNAAEWVADWWDAEYYAHSPDRNPTGPASGDQRVHRAPIANAGGGPVKCRCTVRYGVDPNWEYGIRCASTTPPEGEAVSTAPPSEATPVPSPEQPTPAAAGEATDHPPLQSYRMRTVMRLPEEDVEGAEGPVEQETIAEWDAATPAGRLVVACIEETTIGDTRWTKVKDMPWTQKTLTPEERAAWEHQMSFVQFWGDADALEEELEAALPEGVELVPAQIFPIPIKAAMVFDGEETVNGIHCKRYTVDTDLDYTHDLPGGGKTHTTGHATGVIWIADQEGIPPIIVRALMDEDLIIDGKPSHPYWEHDITDINQPVTIEPPG